MGQDLDYTPEEWKALANMGIKDTNDFIVTLWQELENLSF